MVVTPNLKLPLLDSEENVSEDHLKINQFVEALDTRLGEVAATISGLAKTDHSHEMATIIGLAAALELLASKDHSHKLNDLSDVDVRNAPDGKILQKIAGKWGLGERSYSVTEINNLLANHKHQIDSIQGLTELLSRFADTTKDTRFKKNIALLGDLYLNNKAIIANDADGEFSDRNGDNIDHIWHDDIANAWNFNSDAYYKSRGNAKLIAGGVDLFTNNTTTSKPLSLLKVRNDSLGQENIAADCFQETGRFEQYARPPANASFEEGNRYFSAGIRSYATNYGGTGDVYELMAQYGFARHAGDNNLKTAVGVCGKFTTKATSTGTIGFGYGLRSDLVLEGANIEFVNGVNVHVNPNHNNVTLGHTRGIYTLMNYDAGTIQEDPVALYQNYDGSWDGKERKGIVQANVQSNHLTGTTYINEHEVLHEENLADKARAAGIAARRFASVAHETAPNADGGTAYASSTGYVRPLNTIVTNDDNMIKARSQYPESFGIPLLIGCDSLT